MGHFGTSVGVAEKFAERVTQGTNGAVTISIRPASQLFKLRTSGFRVFLSKKPIQTAFRLATRAAEAIRSGSIRAR